MKKKARKLREPISWLDVQPAFESALHEMCSEFSESMIAWRINGAATLARMAEKLTRR